MGYFGSKAPSGLCQMLLGLQPAHDLYIETHLGGGALMQRKVPALRSIGIDRDRRALEGFTCAYPVELIHGCAHGFLGSFAFWGTELVYSDPPYLRATVAAALPPRLRRAMWPCFICSRVCQMMISGHPSALYDEMLEGWRSVSLQVTTQARVRTEVVWFNFAQDPRGWPCATPPTVSASRGRRRAGPRATGRCRRLSVRR